MASLTHWSFYDAPSRPVRPARRGRLEQRALCGAWFREPDFSQTPSCSVCAARVKSLDLDSATLPLALETRVVAPTNIPLHRFNNRHED